jgi:serine/threonine-protein kinase
MSLQLIVTVGPDIGREFSFGTERQVVIGRGDDCEVQLEDARVSRNHCRITVEGGRATLEDLGSSWGTMVNGQKVSTHQLQPGDVIELSETKLRFDVRSDANAVTWAPSVLQTSAPTAAPVPQIPPSPRAAVPKKEEPKKARPLNPSMQNAMLSARSAEPLLLRVAASESTDHSRNAVVRPADSLDHLVGETLHRYRIVKLLARTATGTLFRAVDTKKFREVALKVLWPFISKQDDDVQRFVRAFEAMRDIKHPNLIAQYGAGITKPHCWVATELVEGASLAELLRTGRQSWRMVARMVSEIAQALVVAADHQVLHRNISPSSIRIRGADGVAKLGDLILAKALEGTRAERLTKPGETVGELPFLAPESLFDEPMDARSDIYSLGITAYTALAGKNPFLGKNVSETIANVINLKPPTLRSIDSSIPPSIENLLFRMIASQPDGRPSAPGDVASELQSILTAI